MSTQEPFSVRMETRAPRDAEDAHVDDAAADELMNHLEDYEGIVSSGPRSWDATVTIPAASPGEAVEEALRTIEMYAAKSGMPWWPMVLVEAVRQDVLAEQLERPSLPDLVSTPEAADILGVKPQRVHQLIIECKEFPEAAYELRAGKLWLRAAIEAFASRKRRAGRPRKATVAATPLPVCVVIPGFRTGARRRRWAGDHLGVNELHTGRSGSLVQLTGLLQSYEVGAGRRGCCTNLLYCRPALLNFGIRAAEDLSGPRLAPSARDQDGRWDVWFYL